MDIEVDGILMIQIMLIKVEQYFSVNSINFSSKFKLGLGGNYENNGCKNKEKWKKWKEK